MKKTLSIILFAAFCAAAGAQEKIQLLIGTYGNFLYEATLDESTGKLDVTGKTEATDPSYLCAGDRALYAVSEHQGHPGVYSFRPDGRSAYLDEIGDAPCFITELADGRHVATADYTSGSISVFIQKNGVLKKNVQTVTYEPHSHIHQLKYIPGTSWLLAADLGDDCIHILKPGKGGKALEDVAAIRDGFPKGCGPRHMEFNSQKRLLYCICELSDELVVFSYDLTGDIPSFKFLGIQRANAVYAGGSADIHISPDGRYLYTSHRLKNEGIATFRLDGNGMPVKIAYTLTGGHPRNFLVTPDGKFILAACRDDASVEVYSVSDRGEPELLSKTTFGSDKPTCVITRKK